MIRVKCDTLDQFFGVVTDAVKNCFDKFGEHKPIFYVADGSGNIALLPGMSTARWQQDLMLLSMRMGVDSGAFQYCCFVTEAWFATETRDSPVIDMAKVVPPSQRPDRREMVVIIGIDRGHHKLASWEIKREGERPRLVPSPGDGFEAISAGFRLFTGDGGATKQ